MNRTMLSILRVLEAHRDKIIGSREISKELTMHGVDLSERTVRYHLKTLDERGYTEVFGKEGRKITEKGMSELATASVSDRVGFIISKIETLSFMTNFDVDREEGDIIINISYFPMNSLKQALKIMRPVFESPLVMSDRVVIATEGEKVGDITVPDGKVAIGTVCSVTINGVFLKAGIPVVSRFGGVLAVEEGEPSRFTSLISYDGSSMDPHLIFIKSHMLNVTDAVRDGDGKVLASFREIPVVSIEAATEVTEKLRAKGIGGVLQIGNPNHPLLEMPVSMDKAGMILVGGLNPIAALEEAGIATESKAMSALHPYSGLLPFKEAARRVS